MSVALITSTHHIPWLEIVAEPVKRVYAVFLIGLGYLLSFLGAKDWGKSLEIKGGRIESHISGVWAYGRRFLVTSVNYENKCRGSCYWLIHRHLKNPETPLVELAKTFEEGPPAEAVELHDQKLIPADLIEEKIWEHRVMDKWPDFPLLNPGVYTFCIGFSEGPRKGHRIALFNQRELFDPNIGLSEWDKSDWEPLLKRIGETIRTSNAPNAFFTLECYSYRLH